MDRDIEAFVRASVPDFIDVEVSSYVEEQLSHYYEIMIMEAVEDTHE